MRFVSLILLSTCAAFAQFNDGITTSVTRSVAIAPDEADFTVVVSTSLDTTQQQVTQVFQDAGIQNSNVTSVAAGLNGSVFPPPTDSQIFYQIAFTAAPTALKDIAKKLDALRTNLPASLSSLQYTAVLSASDAAVEGARITALPQLLSDARGKAQRLASAAGLRLGPVVAVAESLSGGGGLPVGLVYSSVISGAFSSVVGSAGTGSAGSQFTFYASVRFAVQ